MPKKKVALFSAVGFYAREVLIGVIRYAQERGNWDVHFVDDGYPGGLPNLPMMDGVVSYVYHSELLERMRRHNIPIVHADDMEERKGIPTVIVDNREAGRMAARHFLERGFENFGFIANECYYSRLRLEGFAEELKAGGFSCDVLHHKALSEEYWAIDRDKTAKWLGKLPKPLAVLVAHDLYGMLVINLCRDMGLKVPDEVALVGVDNDEAVCHLCSPPLSSVAVPTQRIGYEAAARLDRIMAGDTAGPLMQLIPPQGVIIRQSSDTVGVADDLVRASLRFIREHAAEPISVDDVVAAVPACRSIVERRFRQVLGHSPSYELWKTRIDLAKRMLTQTDLKIGVIAGKSGFAGYRTFHTVFRRRVGIAPAAYRNKAKRT